MATVAVAPASNPAGADDVATAYEAGCRVWVRTHAPSAVAAAAVAVAGGNPAAKSAAAAAATSGRGAATWTKAVVVSFDGGSGGDGRAQLMVRDEGNGSMRLADASECLMQNADGEGVEVGPIRSDALQRHTPALALPSFTKYVRHQSCHGAHLSHAAASCDCRSALERWRGGRGAKQESGRGHAGWRCLEGCLEMHGNYRGKGRGRGGRSFSCWHAGT
eukprot:361365-Chlamydomonas_euryale.AAC.11